MKLAKLNDIPEIFRSIQGEGKSLGKPSVFIRLSLCNLYCTWCDTDYSSNWENTSYSHNNDIKPDYKKYKKKEFTIELTPQDILQELERIDCSNIIITGGEPIY